MTGIGVDEKRFLNATAEHRTVFTTQIVDLDRHRLLDVVKGRSREVLGTWLAAQGIHWCAQITLATLDPAARYRAALAEHLPNATRVVDHFHAVRLANTAIDDVRQGINEWWLVPQPLSRWSAMPAVEFHVVRAQPLVPALPAA